MRIKNSITHKLIILYTSDLFVVHEVAVSAEPAPSHSQRSLQSVWAVGRYLSWYPVAGVAFGAPSTCTQCTPQVTVISGGARGTTLLCLNIHAACARAPASYLAYDTYGVRCNLPVCPCALQQRHPWPTNHVTVPRNIIRADHLTMPPYAVD